MAHARRKTLSANFRDRAGAARLRLALDAAQMGTFDWDMRRGRITWSRWHEELWGYQPGEFGGTYQEFADRVHPEDLPGINAEVDRCIAARQPFAREFRVVPPGGTERWILGRGEFRFGRDARPVRMLGVVNEITDRKRMESALRESEKRYRALIEHSHDAILFLSSNGSVSFVSPSTTKVLGYAPEELLGRPALEFVRPDFREAVGALLAESSQQPGLAVAARAYLKHSDGDWLFLEGYLTNLLHEPAVGAIVINFRDVTARQRMEQALQESEEKFSKAFHANPAMIVITTADGRNVDFNAAYARLVDRPPHEMLGKTTVDLEIVDVAERQKVLDLIERGGGSVHNVEVPIRTSTGKTMHVLLSSDAITLRGVPHRISTVLDITARTQAEAALRETEARFSAIFKAAPGSLVLASLPDGRIVEVNEGFAAITGYTREEVLGRNTAEVDMWADPKARDAFRGLLARGKVVTNMEADLKHKSGTLRKGLVSGQVISISGQDYLLGGFVDITDRRRDEEALRLSHAQLLSFVQQAPVGIALLDRQMRHLVYSRRWSAEFGRGLEDLSGRSYYEVHPDTPERWKAVHQQGLAGESLWFEEDAWVHADGTISWQRWAVLPWRDQRGDIAGIIVFAENITDQKQASAELHDLNRRLMEVEDASRRELARELHDRVGQNLTALNLNLSILQTHLPSAPAHPSNARLHDSLRLVAETMEQVRNVMADLRPPVLDDYGLAAALRWLGGVFSARSGVAVSVEGDEPPARWPPVVETALFRIAEEALTNVGRHAHATTVRITLTSTAAGVRLAIRDDGKGFEPTMLSGRACWGVASMRERADAVGARCRIESAPGQGTTVMVDLPRPE